MHITYDLQCDAAYVYLVDRPETGCVRKTYTCDAARVGGTINLDFDARGRLIGIELLDAKRLLPPEALADGRRKLTFKVQARMCATCIYRPDSPLDLKALEDAVRDPHMGFRGYRICHDAPNKSGVCCRGFWEAHKDEFAAGQIAQRLNRVQFVEVSRD